MSITLSSKPSAARPRRNLLVALAVTILTTVTLLVVWLVLPRGQITMWIASCKSWLLPDIKLPYTPTEDLLMISSAFSVVVSTILEALLLIVLRNKSKKTKKWLRYTLYTILVANAALASTAFIYASVSKTTNETCNNITKSTIADEYGYNRKANAQTLDHLVLESNRSYDEGFPCGRRMASRWLSLLISFFSVILLVSAWLDFREHDRRESETLQLSGEPLSEKEAISTDIIKSIA
ncbi:hypothetical protein F5Y02DRAFT_139169 [Annulohypoxylon stygium]|nr:hypothetical protein F5Y02DRAFT_139169 [Annulohypoxylon stygium]